MIPGRYETFTHSISTQLLGTEGITRIERARKLTLFYMMDQSADSVFFLEAGLVKLVKRDHYMKEVLLTLVHPQEIFGEDAVFNEGRRQSTAEVLQETTVSIIPKEIFTRFCYENPDSWRNLAELMARRAGDLAKKIELVTMQSVEQRILRHLAQLVETIGVPEHDDGHSVHFSQGELATLVGATRETTSSTLNKLAKRGLVTLGRRKLTVLDPNILRQAADASPKE